VRVPHLLRRGEQQRGRARARCLQFPRQCHARAGDARLRERGDGGNLSAAAGRHPGTRQQRGDISRRGGSAWGAVWVEGLAPLACALRKSHTRCLWHSPLLCRLRCCPLLSPPPAHPHLLQTHSWLPLVPSPTSSASATATHTAARCCSVRVRRCCVSALSLRAQAAGGVFPVAR
jgi:hypothetical protein